MAKIVIKADAIDAAKATAEIRTDDQFAHVIGIHPTQLSRVLSGRSEPGNKFIAGMLAAFGVAAFDELFDIVNDEPAAA